MVVEIAQRVGVGTKDEVASLPVLPPAALLFQVPTAKNVGRGEY